MMAKLDDAAASPFASSGEIYKMGKKLDVSAASRDFFSLGRDWESIWNLCTKRGTGLLKLLYYINY